MNIEEFISKKFPKSLVLENISLEEKNDADFYYTNFSTKKSIFNH